MCQDHEDNTEKDNNHLQKHIYRNVFRFPIWILKSFKKNNITSNLMDP